MADVFTKAKRSAVMSRVRGRGNKATEIKLLKLFRRNRIVGWRRRTQLFGSPDFVFPLQRVAVFVDGCFWHSCPEHATQPATNEAFWVAKLTRNKLRDHLVTRTLKQQGWLVLRVWQHELKLDNQDRCIARIRRALSRKTLAADRP
jgi:DNA mismatch endonuclease, patch repair protein